MQRKILSLLELQKRSASIQEHNGTLVLTNGCFDLLHVGHTRYLQSARELGTALAVAINSDESARHIKGEGRPLNSEADRVEIVAALESVDYVVVFDGATAVDVVAAVRPAIYVNRRRLLVLTGERIVSPGRSCGACLRRTGDRYSVCAGTLDQHPYRGAFGACAYAAVEHVQFPHVRAAPGCPRPDRLHGPGGLRKIRSSTTGTYGRHRGNGGKHYDFATRGSTVRELRLAFLLVGRCLAASRRCHFLLHTIEHRGVRYVAQAGASPAPGGAGRGKICGP